MNKNFSDFKNLKNDFPQLNERDKNNNLLIYLDNASTTQKPRSVINKINEYYSKYCSNVHRGLYHLTDLATNEYESSRKLVSKFINANDPSEIIFVKGTTEAVNLVANTYGEENIGINDEIIITHMEHHSNIIPWQILCKKKGAILRILPVNDLGEIIFNEYLNILSKKTKLVALAHVSNVLGTINQVKKITEEAHNVGAKVFIDGAQAVSHIKVDVSDINCDFYAFSSHKMFGPTGVGILYGKKNILENMEPYQGGGNMIKTVSFDSTTYASIPFKFEAGTPSISGAIGLKSSINYINNIGIERISIYENYLLNIATNALLDINGISIIGNSKRKTSILSFTFDGIHPHDVSSILDNYGIAIRAGHLCAQPLMSRFGFSSLCRISLALYNDKKEIDFCIESLRKVKEVMNVK